MFINLNFHAFLAFMSSRISNFTKNKKRLFLENNVKCLNGLSALARLYTEGAASFGPNSLK